MCVFALLVPEINSDAPVQKANACSGGSTAPGPHAKESVPPPTPSFVQRFHFLMSIGHLIHMLAFFLGGGARRFAETERGGFGSAARLLNERRKRAIQVGVYIQRCFAVKTVFMFTAGIIHSVC